MAHPFVLDVPPSSLPGFSVKIRCGPSGTRFRIVSDSSLSEDASPPANALSASESPSEDIQTDDSTMPGVNAVHLSFGDDAQGAFLMLHFTPTYHDPVGYRGRSNSASTSTSTVGSASSSTMPSFSSSMGAPMLWNVAGNTSERHKPKERADLDVPDQAACPDRSPHPERIIEPTFDSISSVEHFNIPPSDTQDLQHISPFLNEGIDLYSLMTMISDNTYAPNTAPFATTSPGSNHSSPPTGSLNQTEPSTPYTTSSPDADSDNKDTSLSHPYLCPQPGCNRRFKREYNLSLHIRTHEPRPKKRFACVFPGCNGLKFSRKHDLFRHICNLHSSTATWTCDWCGSELPNSDALVAHVRIHYSDSNQAGR